MAKSSGTLRFRVVVIGASAGGVEALTELVKMLPATLPAAVFVVLHVSSATPSLLPHILKRAGRLPARHARDGELIRPRRIYIAPPDHHLLLNAGRVAVTRGPRENNARPAIDPLFRTAARHYGPTVVGVVLSGTLDDGTLGLMDIKRAGGIALVQDPAEAMFPSMPNSAIENVAVDRVLPLKEMGPLIARLAREPVPIQAGAAFMAARKQSNRPDIAEVGNDNLKNRLMDGPPSQYTCPECGGVLWELKNGNLLRYRCHVGHGFTAESLMAAQTEKLEAAMWGSLRALEEVAGMRRRLAERSRMGGWELIARRYDEQAKTYEDRAAVIRAVLVEERADHIDGQIARSVEQLAAQAEDLDAELGPTDPAAAFGASRPPDPEIGGPMVLGGQSSHSDKSNGRQSGKRT
ncbi:MAG TPA: chemotaxis protein CheB, partial [Tepidisphaeraceae bacterium]|nr:chemotaxis protein CheB [Tepidisphaeraceae bacterium]